ncbi:hypothetical protein [Chryseobacterium viscerum]|uniref:DUF4421 domain-containing protein n=1 Tax=Chryseobacterium viscerum TaxID=1037377 RepID=A0A5N4BPE9_9FLAO|nr:hypothetical protein [Chryseobacterium viscerum]KAB1230260.1 hypothetical protein F8D52_13845 [Chryseobacterium viscerum]
MKTKIVLLFLLGWVGMVCGQVKLLSERTSNEFSYLQKSNTSDDFLKKLKENSNKKELENLIKTHTGLNLIEINQNTISVEKEELKNENIYIRGGNEQDSIFINLKNPKAFVINGKSNRKLFFYSEGGIFLIETNKKVYKNIIMDRLSVAYKNIGYKCKGINAKTIHDSVFAGDMKTLKNAIILNSADNVTNNNAIAFTSGNDTKLSIGANLNNGKRWFFNISAYTANVNSGLFYSDKSWKTDVGGTFTINKIILRESKSFNPDSCRVLYEKRSNYYNDILIKEYEKLYKTDFKKELNHWKGKKAKIESQPSYTIEDREKMKEIEENIKTLEREMKHYEKIVKNPSKYINDSIIAFDKKNVNVLRGGRLHWIKVTFDVYNQNVGFDTAKVKKFVSAENQIKNYLRSNVNISYNFNQQDSHIFRGLKFKWVNVQFFSNIILGNLLDANIGSEMPILKTIDAETFIVDKNERVLGKYSYLSKAFWTLQSGLQASAFITNNFGITVYGYHTFALQNMDYMDYRNRYALQGGLIFRINDEEDVNKATFRVMAGVDNEPYHTRALKNSFMVKVSIGIPFGLFIKSKKEK